MKVAVIGLGNVGWTLVGLLIKNEKISELLIASSSEHKNKACLLDIASAYPEYVNKVKPSRYAGLSSADVIVLTSGVQIKHDDPNQDIFKENSQITEKILSQINFKKEAILICLGTPVDKITPFAQLITKLPKKQVFGFGGDLDFRRLKYVLSKLNINSTNAHIIGEHGKKTIPVFKCDSEEVYKKITHQVRYYLGEISNLAGAPRNLATAILLNELINSIAFNKDALHYVCGYHSKYERYLTWPYLVSKNGIVSEGEIVLGDESSKELSEYIYGT